MATNPPLHLLNTKRSKEQVRDRARLARPLLQEAVHYGLAAFRRCAYVLRHEDEDYNRAILMPYLHLIEMLDAVRILLAQAAPAPCALQMRSMFEALLTIEYVAEKDTERQTRAFAYLAVHTIANHEHLQKLHALNDPPLPPEHIAAEQAEYEAQVGRAGYREAAKEYDALRKKLKRTQVRWHALYDGPKTIRALADHAGRLLDYDILYTPWSDTVHASNPKWQIVPGRYERGRYRGLRDIAYYSTTISFSMAFFLAATERVLQMYRAPEFPVYQRWLDEEVKPRWRKLHLMRRTGPPW